VTAPVQAGPPRSGGPTTITELRSYPHLIRDDEQPRTYITARERETLRLAANGLTNQAIARAMGITVETVKTRMIKARRKLRAVDRTHAVAIALALGLLSVGDVAVPVDANRGYQAAN